MKERQEKRKQLRINVFEWILSNIEQFDYSLDPSPYGLHFKALRELLLMCSLFRRKFGFLDAPVEQFVSHGINNLRKINFVDNIFRNPGLAIPYAGTYVSLRECGIEFGDLRHAIQSNLDHVQSIMIEDNSFRKMQLSYYLSQGKFKHSIPNVQDLFRSTKLAHYPEILLTRTDESYSFTHIIFALSDFSFVPIRNISKKQLLFLRWTIATLLGRYIMEKDWDLVAELLICCDCLNYCPDPLYKIGWDFLLLAQRRDGSIQNFSFDNKKYSILDQKDRKKYYFEANYHPTIVSGIASILNKVCEPQDVYDFSSKFSSLNVESQLDRGHKWITSVYDALLKEPDISSLLYFLIGIWACSVGSRKRYPNLKHYALEIYKVIESASNRNLLSDCDPAQILISMGIFRKLGLRIVQFEDFAKESLHALQSDGQAVSKNTLCFFPISYLLDILGFKSDFKWYDFKNTYVDHDITQCNLIEIVNLISKITNFGTIKAGNYNKKMISEIRTMVAIYLSYYLKHYRLEEMLMLLRSMNYLKLTGTMLFRESLKFLMRQQQQDGKLGFYTDEVVLLKETNSGYNATKKLFLPLTVSLIWTLVELQDTSFILFNSIKA